MGEFLAGSDSGGAAGLPKGHPPLNSAGTQGLDSALPPGHPPIEFPKGDSPTAEDDSVGEAATPLYYEAPKNWSARPVTRQFRQAEYSIPRVASDVEDGELIVYYFGKGEGGTVELNLERWKGMFTTSDGHPVSDGAYLVETFESNGLQVTTLDIAGHYADAMMSPDRAAPSKEPHRMLAAIVETPEGPWFFKAIGPATTMGEHRDAFMELLKTVRR